jgi:hypothetical protein
MIGRTLRHRVPEQLPQQAAVEPQAGQASHTLLVVLHSRPLPQGCVDEQDSLSCLKAWQCPEPSQYCPEQQGKSLLQLSPALRQGGGPHVPAKQVLAEHSAGPVQVSPLSSGVSMTHWLLTQSAGASQQLPAAVQPVLPNWM